MSWTKVVAITGCDSGLGWAMAARAAREGFVTIAGMYNGSDTEAAEALKSLCVHPYKLDVTDSTSVTEFGDYVKNILTDNPHYKLYAVINNAGVMTIANYEWHTPQIIENTINVNLLGAMRVVSSFLPELRKSGTYNDFKPRIINVASHCGLQPLPGFGPYCASKAGLLAWTRALHLEHFRDGLSAVAFVPGGFIGSSNLTTNQVANGDKMLKHLTEEQKSVYEKRLKTLNNYLGQASKNMRFDSMTNENITETFLNALTDRKPKKIYKVESLRYKLYYNLLKLPFPDTTYHWLIRKFLSFPDDE
ncbi:D-beta-hydroxybutyrate dehydrogenase, mitochondrial isoform X2 [Bicyclus anynana]|uniref:D-beta-hydroxybutyrate dehydrogenase, mitochondrial isoform X2 n=1 Tax=Bicyclus anynana TaxID=110368 RepID=A0A6J1NE70_BICAN|nr:D-beta-hydroxybutyrate dehydrogenase, mitochondrial isoform X2 [Bicyclus anynana]